MLTVAAPDRAGPAIGRPIPPADGAVAGAAEAVGRTGTGAAPPPAAAAGACTGAAAATGAAAGPGADGAGILIVGAAVGFAGRLIRTVSFFGCTFTGSAGFGGTPAPGVLVVLSDISCANLETDPERVKYYRHAAGEIELRFRFRLRNLSPWDPPLHPLRPC